MKASEARYKSVSKHLPLDKALIEIQNNAERGLTQVPFICPPLSDEARDGLMRLGYKTTIREDMMGVEFYLVSW